jgi:hypothetical protein
MPGDSKTVPGATVAITAADVDGSARTLTRPFARMAGAPATSGARDTSPAMADRGGYGGGENRQGQGRKRGDADAAPAHQVLSACRTTVSASVNRRMDCSNASRALARTSQSATAGWRR